MRVFESDVVIVGAGIMGAATARALSKSGLTVNILEQFEPGHTNGSSHGTSRIFRLSYPDAMYVSMAQEALTLWREAEEETGESLLVTTGGFDTGEGIEANADALEECGAEFEMVKEADVVDRWPQVRLGPDEVALWQPDAGVALADQTLAAFLRVAKHGGVRLYDNTRVESLELSEDGVQVHARGKTFHGGVVIVTSGGWAAPLLATAGVTLDVKPTRETVSYFSIKESAPTFVEWRGVGSARSQDDGPSIYALPAPGFGLKAGEHIAGPPTDPDRPGEVNLESVERISAWVADRFPGADPTPAHAETCIYTNTPDEHFVLERHGPIVVGSPCSGHGFKFAPLIGKRLAQLATR
ncbi:MAG: FAD-dependent oxidoreductase [Actinomycetota bacterium]|nr:FAD-dependent oxidoreductase [Actinomycetota bacterium]